MSVLSIDHWAIIPSGINIPPAEISTLKDGGNI